MRSSRDFIEVHGLRTRKVQLINKNAIIFVVKSDDEEQRAIIKIRDTDRVTSIECEESYKEVAQEILWYEEKDLK